MNKEFLKMQKIAGLITENQFKQLNEAEKSIQTFGPRLMDGLKKDGFDAKLINNDDLKLKEMVKNSDKKLALVVYEPAIKFISITTNKNNQDAAFKVVDSGFVKELLPDDYQYSKQGAFFIEIQGK